MASVAQTILSQLGGNRFVAMTGARDLVGGSNFLRLRLPARTTTNNATHMTVTLDEGRDLYVMEFSRWNGRALVNTPVSAHDGLYADMLADVFTDQTGLYTRM